MQTERKKDIINKDWSESRIFRRAMKYESIKRGLHYEEVSSEEELISEDTHSNYSKAKRSSQLPEEIEPIPGFDEENAQDPDTDIPLDPELP